MKTEEEKKCNSGERTWCALPRKKGLKMKKKNIIPAPTHRKAAVQFGIQFSHMFIFLLLPIRRNHHLAFPSRVSFRSSKQEEDKNYTLKATHKKLQHMTLLCRKTKNNKKTVYIRKAKKVHSLLGYVLPEPSHTKFSAIFIWWCKWTIFSALLNHISTVCWCQLAHTVKALFSSLLFLFGFTNSRKRIVYAIWQMLYKIRHLQYIFKHIYAACYFSFTSFRWGMELCVPTHTKNSLSLFIYCRKKRNIEIIKKVLVVAWIWTFDSLLTIRFLNIWEWTQCTKNFLF